MKSSLNVNVNQKGFTLIELVVVIVILGILAVTAAPKFIDLTGDAKRSVVRALEGSLKAAAELAHAKALVAGDLDATISIASESITFVNGYPNRASIDNLIDLDTSSSDAIFTLTGGTGTLPVIFTHSDATTADKCRVSYSDSATANIKPVITSVVTGC